MIELSCYTVVIAFGVMVGMMLEHKLNEREKRKKEGWWIHE